MQGTLAIQVDHLDASCQYLLRCCVHSYEPIYQGIASSHQLRFPFLHQMLPISRPIRQQATRLTSLLSYRDAVDLHGVHYRTHYAPTPAPWQHSRRGLCRLRSCRRGRAPERRRWIRRGWWWRPGCGGGRRRCGVTGYWFLGLVCRIRGRGIGLRGIRRWISPDAHHKDFFIRKTNIHSAKLNHSSRSRHEHPPCGVSAPADGAGGVVEFEWRLGIRH
ncbi:MAG: hypothetical protein BWY76_00876 [bacterium ADurb.Bin429]|nr:MAG: hypothetical protein BWY76_00876 [bacterium ADurb.Bin429]